MRMASNMTSLGTSLAPASIMTTFLPVETTVTSRSLTLRSSLVGLKMSLPSTRPTFSAATGPFQGMSEMASAADVPISAAISGEQSWSTDMTVHMTDTSLRKSWGKSGRMGRSMTREVRMPFSPGRPSRRLKLPGMRPTAYSFSSKSTLRGKKSMPSRGRGAAVTQHSTRGVAVADHDGGVGELGAACRPRASAGGRPASISYLW